MKEVAEQRAEKTRLRELELKLTDKKHALEQEKQRAKVRKMGLDAQRDAQQAQQFQMMMSFMFNARGMQFPQATDFSMPFNSMFSNHSVASTSTSTSTSQETVTQSTWLSTAAETESEWTSIPETPVGMIGADLQEFLTNKSKDN